MNLRTNGPSDYRAVTQKGKLCIWSFHTTEQPSAIFGWIVSSSEETRSYFYTQRTVYYVHLTKNDVSVNEHEERR
jgi:hypothetical protein